MAVTVAIELCKNITTEAVVKCGLVEQFNTDDDVLVALLCVLLGDCAQNLKGPLDSVALLPRRAIHALARVVKPVLGSRCTMEVNENLQAYAASPVDGSINVDSCSTDVGRAKGIVCPVANGDTDNVEARLLDFVEVLPGNESIPMVTKDVKGILAAKLFSQCVLCALSGSVSV